MNEKPTYEVHDVVRLKKKHPCGENRWEILRVGMDFRLRCLGCRRLIMIPRRKFEKSVRELVARPKTEGEEE